MSERYSRLFALPENLYTVGSPVIIAAGTLLKDTQTGKIIAQLKLKSISAKAIKAVKVKLDLFDTAGNFLDESVVHDYLDLNVSRDGEFGQKNPIMVPNITARSYSVSVTEVVFRDYSVWATDGGNWESLSKHFPLVFEDSELRKQYEIKFGAGSIYEAKTDKDLWFCTCGAINHDGEMCHICHNTLLSLQTVDMAKLAEEKEARLEEEARQAAKEKKQAEEKAAKQAELNKKRNAKIIGIITLFTAVVAVYLLVTQFIIPYSKYQKAESLMEQGKYEEAIAAFENMGDYKDADSKKNELKKLVAYQYATSLMETEQYIEASMAFSVLGEYKDAAEKAVECAMLEEKPAYEAAVALEESGDKARAAIAFAKLSAYPDAKKRSLALWDEIAVRDTICDASRFTLGLKADGTVIATGNKNIKKNWDLDDAESWAGITAVDTGRHHYIVLFEDGTVETGGVVGDDYGYEHFSLGKWSDIVAISAKNYTSMGLKSDGTVVVGVSNRDVDISDWSDIVAISAGSNHIVGLKADGTVIAKYVGKEENKYGQCCDVSSWTDVVAISAGGNYTLGLKADGTVLYAGTSQYVTQECCEWDDVVSISAGVSHAVGLRSDGTVLSVGYNDDGRCNVTDWTNIVAVSAEYHTVGLHSDGTVVVVGDNDDGERNVWNWADIKLPN